MTRSKIATGLLALIAASGTSFGAIVAEWNADGYADGTAWVGTSSAIVREGTPTGGVAAFNAANNISYVNFGSPDTAFEVAAANNPVAGLSAFSASAVFRTTSNGSAGENDFWRNEGLVGIELPGGGVGDWGLGIATGGFINGGSALHGGDSGSIGPVANDGMWHVVTMVIDQTGATTHDRRLYLDGSEVASDLGLVYGGGSSVAANSVLYLGDHAPNDGNASKENYMGDIAHIRLDDLALSAGDVATAHGNLLGTLEFIPEPSATILLIIGGLLALKRRRW